MLLKGRRKEGRVVILVDPPGLLEERKERRNKGSRRWLLHVGRTTAWGMRGKYIVFWRVSKKGKHRIADPSVI
jgi:hypothetical protein